ncbi:MAG: DinB family protein, partial [Caldilineaceae bacterium]|nr:DinB family protein [Caldilineaceae bacterium]
MRTKLTKEAFLADLHQRIAEHCETVVERFAPLADEQLQWQPAAKGKIEWSILQCFEHLNLTHQYYNAKIDRALSVLSPVATPDDFYKASFWGSIYMYFALNPKYTFPSPAPITPTAQPDRRVIHAYLACQEALLQRLEEIAHIDLNATLIPIEKFVRFNLGDCLKILVYHDELHIGQAQGITSQF